MKNAKLGDYLLWEGRPAKIVGTVDAKQALIEMLAPRRCPHCDGDVGKEQFSVVVASPLFQESAEKLPTLDS